MEYTEIRPDDYGLFHDLLDGYYREGEDRDTPQDVVDAFIRSLFDQVSGGGLSGCFAKENGTCAGFALWTVDTEGSDLSEMPGYGTILEIGLLPSFRRAGRGKELVAYIENRLRESETEYCYVCAYGPARAFWTRCGYEDNRRTAGSGFPLLVKRL